MSTMNGQADDGDHYFDLVRQFPLRPIRSDKELDEALRMVDLLLDRRDLTAGEDDYLDVLTDLIQRFERKAYPMGPIIEKAN